MDTKEYALESMDEGVMIISSKGRINYANPYARRIFELADTENVLFSRVLSDDNRSNDEIIDLVVDTITGEAHPSGEMVHYTAGNGETYSLMTSCTRMGDGEYVFTFSDRTALVKESIKRKDSVKILTLFFMISCLWTIGVSVWMRTGEQFPVGYLTIVMEVLGTVGLFYLMKTTSIRIMDFGLSLENIRPTMKRTAIRLLILLASLSALKAVLLLVYPGYFPENSPFWDWSQADFRLIKYIITSFVQEFLARGGVQTSFSRVFESGTRKNFSIFLTSLYFMALHFQYGLPMMFGAGVLSILLGYMYKKDGNIFGVTLFHYCFGKFADFLLLLQ